MKQSDEIMKKKILSVKSWLEKAEHSYEGEEATKGSLQLMLAKAEMQHLEESDSSRLRRVNLLAAPFMMLAVLVVGGGFYLHHQQEEPRAVATEVSTPFITEESSGTRTPGWAKTLQDTSLQNVKLMKPVSTVQNHGGNEANHGKGSNHLIGSEPVENVKRNGEMVPAKATTSAADIMNAKQIKETVYDAGRSLRGN